jgi:hypothetical protein
MRLYLVNPDNPVVSLNKVHWKPSEQRIEPGSQPSHRSASAFLTRRRTFTDGVTGP